MLRAHTLRNSPIGVMTNARLWRFLALLLWATLAASACADMSLPLPEPTQAEPEKPLIQPTPDLAAEADQAFLARNMPLSELLYSRLLEREDVDKAGRMLALDRLAQSAYASRHYYQAKQALDRLASMDNAVLAKWSWHEIYIKTLGALDRPDLVDNHQAWLAAHTELPFIVRARGAMAFSEIYGRAGDYVRAVNVLARAHKQAPDRAAKSAFEKEYALALRELPEQQVLALAKIVGNSGQGAFPHVLIRQEAFRRGQPVPVRYSSESPARPELAPALASSSMATVLSAGPLLAQSGNIVSDQPGQPGLFTAKNGPVRIALALPLSGRFAPTGWKVLRGAFAAQARLAAKGRQVEIRTVNTEAPDWREQLAALPPDFRIVGGPLQVDHYKALDAAGVTAQRAVFAFVPDIGMSQIGQPGQLEGRSAWRFFPSPRDQVRALLRATADNAGIRSVAVLAPRNRYGQRMAEIFVEEAKAKGLRIAASGTYAPDDHPRWKSSVASLLKVPEGFRGNKNMSLPLPDFGAVFVPEDWGNAEMLVSNFHFYEGDHLLFLGPELWSVALDSQKDIDDTYFQQAVCPGAWWADASGAKALQAALDKLPAQSVPGSQAAQQLTGPADFWVGLGHDFVQMAARLGLGETAGQLDPALVNARLAALSNTDMPWSMAPMAWDAAGHASQAQYLFAPRKEGKSLVDPDELRASVAKSRDRREHRAASFKEIRKAREAAKQQ